MCGITGYLGGCTSKEELESVCWQMTNALTHRGPDDSGVWSDMNIGIALGQRRLSILDLSEHGHQPMISHDGRLVLVYNGEIYNHIELRGLLESTGHQFHGTSDTEVALCAIQQWGLADALKRFVGMFALALWDRETRNLFLARDRLGEKPLYYGRFNGIFAFASELKALTVHPSWVGNINHTAIALQLKYTYIPAPHSIYKDIHKLEPGTYIELDSKNNYQIKTPQFYWSFNDIVQSGISSRHDNTDPEIAVEQLSDLLTETISNKIISDVPLGAFLSGGIDSSLIVALMQSQSSKPVKTFSIGFNEPEYNEAEYAKRVAHHIGTDHTELYVTPEDSLAVIPRLPQMYDEPFSDSSQIPTYLVSRLAKQDVTVVLSGDGGDELFGGYNRYMVGLDAWNGITRVPRSLRIVGGNVIQRIPPGFIDVLIKPLLPLLPREFRFKQIGQKLHKLANVWDNATPDSIYNNLICLWHNSEDIVNGASHTDALGCHRTALERLDNFTDRMMFTDTVTYLPDDILVKVDRASMAVSLEVRVPYLDHRIVEFAWQQPADFKIRGNQGKWLLRKVLERYIPDNLIDRPKMGFGVPIDHWLRGPLKEWAGDLLSEQRLRQQGLMQPGPIQEKWQQHLTGKTSWQYLLWPLLMFQAWHDHWIN